MAVSYLAPSSRSSKLGPPLSSRLYEASHKLNCEFQKGAQTNKGESAKYIFLIVGNSSGSSSRIT